MVVTLSACEEPPYEPPGEVVFSGDFIEFRVAEDAPEYCDGVPEYLDQYLGALYGELEVESSPGSDLVSYSIVHPDDVEANGERFNAFASSKGIITGIPVIEHELVHAAENRGPYGRGQYLLTEGLAERFGGDALTNARGLTRAYADVLVQHVEDEEGIRGYAYGDAGRFVAYLDDYFGRDVLLRLLEVTSRTDTSVEVFTSKVEEVTGVAWEELAADYDASEICDQGEYWDASAACEIAEPLALCEGSEEKRHHFDLSCGAPDVLGERKDFTGESGPEVWTYRTVTFEEPGIYWIFFEVQSGQESVGYVSIKSCGGGCGSFFRRLTVSTDHSIGPNFQIEEPGEYLVKIARPLDALEEMEFRFLGAVCE